MTTNHEHAVDNQGLCHGCGVLLDESTWDAYTGKTREHWVRHAIAMMRNPLWLVSPEYHECKRECELRGITVSELLDVMRRRVKNA